MASYVRASLALCLVTSMGCGDDSFPFYAFDVDPDLLTDASGDVSSDASVGDTGSEDTGSEDTGSEDTGSEDTGSEDTGSEDTGSEDTGSEDTGSEDTGSEDTGSDDTGSDDTGSDDTGSEDTGSEDTIECDDDDDDGVCNDDDICEGYDDAEDSDGDGIPNGCDRGCAAGVVAQELFGDVYGCAGSVGYDDRAELCADGYLPASAAEWVAARGDAAPTYHYWTDQNLHYRDNGTDDTGSCAVGTRDTDFGSVCQTPMRVCASETPEAFDATDPLGNSCTWSGCGYGTVTPNEFFGGCSSNFVGEVNVGVLAGTLCVEREVTQYDIATADVETSSTDWGNATRGNVYLATEEGVIYGFDQFHSSDEPCTVDTYIWSSSDRATWTVLHAGSMSVDAGETFVGPSNLHIPVVVGRYYGLALGWTCSAKNVYGDVPTAESVGFGTLDTSFIGHNEYPGFSLTYEPPDASPGADTYAQHVYVYGVTPAP